MSKFIVTCTLIAILAEIFLIAIGKVNRRNHLAGAKTVLIAEYDNTHKFIATVGGGILFCLPLFLIGVLDEGNPVIDRVGMVGYYLMTLYFTLVIFNTKVILTETTILVSRFLGNNSLISRNDFRGARESKVSVGMRGYRFSVGKNHVVVDEKMENSSFVVIELRSCARGNS